MKKYHFEYMDDIAREEYEALAQKQYYVDKQLAVLEIEEGVLLPVNTKSNPYGTLWGSGGVVDSKGNYVEASAQVAFHMNDRVRGKYDIEEKALIKRDETVIYMNFFIAHWGHFLIDVVSRLWYVIQKLQEKENVKIAYIVEKGKNNQISGHYLEFLNLLGIAKENLISIHQPTKFKKIIIPESALYPGKYYTKEYKFIFDTIKENVEDTEVPYDKVYFSRQHLKTANKKEIGEKSIEKWLQHNGFKIIAPEKYTVKQQIQIMKKSNVVAAISGTLPHNLLFANDETKLLIINKTIRVNRHQFLIDEIRHLDVTYLDCHISLFPVLYGAGPFIITLNDNTLRYAKDHQYRIKYNRNYYRMYNKYKVLWYLYKYIKTYGEFPIQGNGKIEDIEKIYNYYRKKI